MSLTDTLVLGLPSKGRLMEQAIGIFADAGMPVSKIGPERGYRGRMTGLDAGEVEIAFLSASEIAHHIKSGHVHLGVTGEDLLRETIGQFDAKTEIIQVLGFGAADVVVAVPDEWLDCWVMADLDDIASQCHEIHGRRLKVATKYVNLTRRFFMSKSVAGYRIVESLGATEGAPAAGSADLIVDITSSGSTLKANHLRILEDGLILKSQAVLARAKAADWNSSTKAVAEEIARRLSA